MKSLKLPIPSITIRSALYMMLALIPVNTARAAELTEGLSDCAQISAGNKRLACYDELAHSTSNQTVSSQTPHNPTQANKKMPLNGEQNAGVITNLSDNIGGGKFATAAGEQKLGYKGRVTSCKKSSDRRWFYLFENGQVWKQVDRRKRRHKDCNFNVVISKHSFGYVMRIDGQDSKIHVARRR